jgi:hypothetical protein
MATAIEDVPLAPAAITLLTPATFCIAVTRVKDTILMPLPPELWRPCSTDGGVLDSGCVCDVCKADGSRGFWDTLAVGKDAPKGNRNDFTSTVHYPGLHRESDRKANASRS